MMKAKVSVVIPVYNVKDYLRQCLDSLLAQTLAEIEIVCVDDGSGDGSAEILREYEQRGDRVKVRWQENRGAGTARNEGIRVATGEYLFFCDADDYLAPDLLEKLYAAAVKHDAELVFFTRTLWSEAQGAITKEYQLPQAALTHAQPFAAADFKDDILSLFGPQPWNKLVKAEFVREKNLRYQEVPRMNDVLFSAVAVASAERITVLPVSGYFHRIEQPGEHLQSQGGNNRTPYIAFDVYEEIRKELLTRGLYATFRKSFYKTAESTFAYSLRTVDDVALLAELFRRAREFMLRAVDEDCADVKSLLIANATLSGYLGDLAEKWPVKPEVVSALAASAAAAPRRKPVALICDDAYTLPCVVALTSLALAAAQREDYVIYVCVNGMSDENRAAIAALKGEPWKLDIRFVELDMERYRSIYVHYDGNTGAGSITAFAKFDLPYLLAEDKVLYLDGDILVKKDPAPLFDVALGGAIVAAVRDSGRLYNNTGLRAQLKCYFNSGVMLLDLKKMRQGDYRRKLIEAKIALNNPKLVDQDAFNIAFDGRVKQLPIDYNALMVNLHNNLGRFTMRRLNAFYATAHSCVRALEDDLTILHFASKEKPWKYSDVRYVREWDEYYARSPLAETPLPRGRFHEDAASVADAPVAGGVIPVMMATDANYLPYTYVTILSALANHRGGAAMKFHIAMPAAPTAAEWMPFAELAKKFAGASIEYVVLGDDFANVQMKIAHISKPTFYRLRAASLFPQYDKIIYLDGDIVVEGDLAKLYAIDLGENYLAGVRAASYRWNEKWFVGYCQRGDIPGIDQYINAGMIMMNLAAIRRDGLEPEFIERAGRGYDGQDQDVLNGACYGRIQQLDYAFNCQISKYETLPGRLKKVFSEKEIIAADNWPEIIHYAAKNKPWQDFSLPLADRWWKYAAATPYYERFVAEAMNTAAAGGVAARMRYLDMEDNFNAAAAREKKRALEVEKLAAENKSLQAKLAAKDRDLAALAKLQAEIQTLKTQLAGKDRDLAVLKCRRGKTA